MDLGRGPQTNWILFIAESLQIINQIIFCSWSVSRVIPKVVDSPPWTPKWRTQNGGPQNGGPKWWYFHRESGRSHEVKTFFKQKKERFYFYFVTVVTADWWTMTPSGFKSAFYWFMNARAYPIERCAIENMCHNSISLTAWYILIISYESCDNFRNQWPCIVRNESRLTFETSHNEDRKCRADSQQQNYQESYAFYAESFEVNHKTANDKCNTTMQDMADECKRQHLPLQSKEDTTYGNKFEIHSNIQKVHATIDKRFLLVREPILLSAI